MSTRPSTLVAMCVLIAGTTAMAQVPPLPPPDQTAPMVEELVATQGFQERINQYVAVHRVLELPLTPLRPTLDMSRIQASMQALAYRIRVCVPSPARRSDHARRRADVPAKDRDLPSGQRMGRDSVGERRRRGRRAGRPTTGAARQHGVARAGAIRIRTAADAGRTAAAARGTAIPHHRKRPRPLGPSRQPDRGLSPRSIHHDQLVPRRRGSDRFRRPHPQRRPRGLGRRAPA